MTDLGSLRGWDDAHALSGAYALDALDAEERTRFESHLAQCPTCRDEVAELSATAVVLGVGTELAPPAELRAEVLRGVAEIRPLPPVTSERRPGDDRGDGPSTGSRQQRPISLEAHRQRRLRRPLMMVAAAVVLLLGVGLGWARPWSSSEPTPADNFTAAERVLQAADAVRVDKRFPDGSTAAIVVSRSLKRAVIVTDDMDPAPKGHVYELWYQSPAGDMVRAGLMPNIPDTTLILEGDASRAVGVGITVEPEGGSEHPSSEPIAYFNLEA